MKKLLGVLVALTLAFTLAACQDSTDIENGDESTYMALEINPGVEFILDEDGNVLSIQLLNEDAEAVAADLDLEGLPHKEALELFIDAAIETGYIDVDSDENIVTLTSDDEGLQDEHKADVEAILAERGVGAAIFGGEMNEEYYDLAEQYEISVGRARLISRAIAIDGELTFDEALDLEQGDLMQILITEHRAQMDEFIGERRDEALETKNEMREMAQERVEQHRQKVEDGDVETPDFDAIREDVEGRIEGIRSEYQTRVNEKRDEAQDRKDNSIPEGNNYSYSSVDINPGVEFILDEDGEVVSIVLLNEDAEAVAADLDLEGLPHKEALELFIDAAIETGYIDVDSDENIVTLTSDDEGLQDEHKADVEAILAERGVGAAIFGGEMNEEYYDLAEQYEISVGRARLISRAIAIDGELTFDEALDLEQGDLMQILITEHRAQMDEFIGERRDEALETKNEMREMAQERVEQHRQKVEDGDVETPDFDAIREDVEGRIEGIRSEYQTRVNEKRDKAQDTPAND